MEESGGRVGRESRGLEVGRMRIKREKGEIGLISIYDTYQTDSDNKACHFGLH